MGYFDPSYFDSAYFDTGGGIDVPGIPYAPRRTTFIERKRLLKAESVNLPRVA